MHFLILNLVLAVSFAVVGCAPPSDGSGNSPGTGNSVGTGNSPGTGNSSGTSSEAEEACKRPSAPGSCYDACTSNDQCGQGAYCRGNSFCAADCLSASDCNSNQVCNDNGRCVSEVETITCDPKPVEVKPIVPNLVFLIDRSGSMAWGFEGDQAPTAGKPSRWNAVDKALFGANGNDGVLQSIEDLARVGLAAYSSIPSTNNSDCTTMESTPNVSRPGTSDAQTLFDASTPNGGTPTGGSIRHLRTNSSGLLYKAINDAELKDSPTVLILATDGEPNSSSSACYTSSGSTNDKDLVVDQATAAYAEGITTFVIGVAFNGSSTAVQHLDAVARAGQGGNQSAKHFAADNPDALEDAIRQIALGAIGCEVKLAEELSDVDQACQKGTVKLDGTVLNCDDPVGGWSVVDTSTIELTGTKCDTWKDGNTHELTASFPCPVSAE